MADYNELERILWQELGSKEDYDKYTNGMPCGSNVAIFVRSWWELTGQVQSDAFQSLYREMN